MIFFVVLFFIFKAGPQSVESLLVLVKYWTKRRNHVVFFDDQGKKKKQNLVQYIRRQCRLITQAIRCSGKWINEPWLWNILEQSDIIVVWWLFSEQMAFTRICSHYIKKKTVRKIETKNDIAKRTQWWCKLNTSWGWFTWNHVRAGSGSHIISSR